MVAHPLARGHPARQTGYQLGMHHGVYAFRRHPGGAADSGRTQQSVVYADHLFLMTTLNLKGPLVGKPTVLLSFVHAKLQEPQLGRIREELIDTQ